MTSTLVDEIWSLQRSIAQQTILQQVLGLGGTTRILSLLRRCGR